MNKTKTLLMSISICLIVAVMSLSTALVFAMSNASVSGQMTAVLKLAQVEGTITSTANYKYISNYNESTGVITYGTTPVLVNGEESASVSFGGDDYTVETGSFSYADVNLNYGETVEYIYNITNTSEHKQYLDFTYTINPSKGINQRYKLEYWWSMPNGQYSDYYILEAYTSPVSSTSKNDNIKTSSMSLKRYENTNGVYSNLLETTTSFSDSSTRYELCTFLSSDIYNYRIQLDYGCECYIKFSLTPNEIGRSFSSGGNITIQYFAESGNYSDPFSFFDIYEYM